MSSVWRCCGMLCALGVLLLASSAQGVEVPLTVSETAGVARTNEPVTTGVPFARGVLKDVKSLVLSDAAGRALAAQFRKLAPWPDGSVRVALVDTQVSVPANGSVKLKLGTGGARVFRIQGQRQIQLQGGNAEGHMQVKVQVGVGVGDPNVVVQIGGDNGVLAPVGRAKGIRFEEGPEGVTVDTGPLEFVVSKKQFNLFRSLKLNGKELLGAGGAKIVLTTADGRQVTSGDAPADVVTLEEIGKLRVVVLVRGKFAGVHRNLLSYTCRITAYAGKPYLKVGFWLQNDGRYGYVGRAEAFVFDGLSIDLPLKATKVECEGARIDLGSLPAGLGFDLKQRNETGRGNWNAFSYAIPVAEKAKSSGGRASGRIALVGPNGAANVAVRHFWQNYPKGLRVKDGVLSVDLWPRWDQWPRSSTPGSRANDKAVPAKPGAYVLPGAVRKRHEMILAFSAQPKPMAATAAVLDQPLMAMPAPAYAADTMAFGTFAPGEALPADAASAQDVKKWNQWARNVADPAGGKGVVAARTGCRYGPFYGWMDFGDLFWQPGCSSLHYDWTWVMALGYVRTLDRHFLDRAGEMALHRIDVDQIWSDREYEAFRGLTRYEKGYANIHGGIKDGHYKPIPSHNWIRGVVWWYYLTGDQSAYECAVRNASIGIKLRQVDRQAKNPGGQLRSSGWAIGCLCDAYDLTGEKKYLDWALILWNKHLKPGWKAKGPNFGTATGGNVLQWFYCAQPLVLLHQRSGDADLLAYIRDIAKYMGDDAALTTYSDDMASHTNNYLGYLAAVDGDAKHLKRARELFAHAMKRNNRLSLYAGSGAYTKEVCKKLRNGHIWLWAERKLTRGR